jgi:hypothetical protein
MPEPITAATTAAILPTTLLLLYFVAPPADYPKGETKTEHESKSLWTLQSTARIDFKTPDACKKIGTKMIEELEFVSTLTVRAYCICENGDGNKCPSDTWNTFMSSGQKTENTQPTMEPLGKPAPPPRRRR